MDSDLTLTTPRSELSIGSSFDSDITISEGSLDFDAEGVSKMSFMPSAPTSSRREDCPVRAKYMRNMIVEEDEDEMQEPSMLVQQHRGMVAANYHGAGGGGAWNQNAQKYRQGIHKDRH
eukprot:TRINITY_DN15013_c0_g2_i1.p1 TRINITY_DN15013_c0_g2~~TRINITY_DN15013_c0_g2_i1.p1  ORF type:complete len:130 (+),score=45.92 TRINITY_DN15013_c0_g2_i1:34-390(+)